MLQSPGHLATECPCDNPQIFNLSINDIYNPLLKGKL